MNEKLIKDIENCKLIIPKHFELKCLHKTTDEYFSKKCLYVAKGPSLNHIDDYINNYENIATVNESCLKVNRIIDFAFFLDKNAILNSKSSWHKIKNFVVPAMVFDDGYYKNDNFVNETISVEDIPEFPIEKAIILYSSQDEFNKKVIEHKIKLNKLVITDTAVFGMHFLTLCGYNDFMLLGHDGGVGYANNMPNLSNKRNMQKFRDELNFVIKTLKKKFKIKVKFYK